VQTFGNEIFKEQKLTIGLDLGDRWSFYCVLDEAGEIILEQKVATTPEKMKQTFEKIPRSLIALETGTHSPWISGDERNRHCSSTPPGVYGRACLRSFITSSRSVWKKARLAGRRTHRRSPTRFICFRLHH
jgi:predicted NBD/HSP70 family sugar kinase